MSEVWVSKEVHERNIQELKELRKELAKTVFTTADGIASRTYCLSEDPELNPTTVSFEMTYGDWCRLQESKSWRKVERKIHQSQKEHSQMLLRGSGY